MNREEREQIAIFKWAEMQKGLSLLHHIPNGGKRGKVEAARLKAAGVKAGIPDICLPIPRNGYGALYIELKAPSDKLKEKIIALYNELASPTQKLTDDLIELKILPNEEK